MWNDYHCQAKEFIYKLLKLNFQFSLFNTSGRLLMFAGESLYLVVSIYWTCQIVHIPHNTNARSSDTLLESYRRVQSMMADRSGDFSVQEQTLVRIFTHEMKNYLEIQPISRKYSTVLRNQLISDKLLALKMTHELKPTSTILVSGHDCFPYFHERRQ